jgi:hypothetical protein
MPQSANWANDVQTFWPFTTYSSPSSSARVMSEGRSDPAAGSLKSWHHSASPRSIGPRCSSCWAAVPQAMSVGPTMARPTDRAPALTSKCASSWEKIICSTGVPLRPPNSFGQVMPAHPPS